MHRFYFYVTGLLFAMSYGVAQNVVLNPTGSQTINQPATTTFSTNSLDHTLLANQFAGSTADAKITNAINSLPSGGGTVDARGLIGNQTISATVAIRSNMTLILPAGAIWTCTIASGTPCFEMASDSGMVSNGHGTNSTHIVLASGANVTAMLELGSTGVVSHFRVEGVEFSGSPSATVTEAIVDARGVYDSSFRNLTVDDFNGRGVWIHDTSSSIGGNSLDFYSLLLDGSHNAGAKPLVIEQTLGASNVSQMRFYGGDFGHPGAGQHLVTVDGHGYAALTGVYFYGTYMEANNTDTSTPIVSISDANNVLFDGVFVLRGAGGSTAYGFTINQSISGSNLTNNVTIRNATVTGGSGWNSIQNNIDSNYTVSSASILGDYVFLNKYVGAELAQIGSLQTSANSATVLGNLNVRGTLTKSSGSFVIDDPVDPANKFLYHSFVESPDMMDIYNGIATLDGQGKATIKLPDYFEALNRTFRYQLTALGRPGPNLYVAHEISSNRFQIAGGRAHSRVSWQVTGVRHDAYADTHRIKVEEYKPIREKGHYLYPELFGAPQRMEIQTLSPAADPDNPVRGPAH